MRPQQAGSDLGYVTPTPGLGSGASPRPRRVRRRANLVSRIHHHRLVVAARRRQTHPLVVERVQERRETMSSKPKAEAKVAVLKGQDGKLSRACSVGRRH